MTTGISSCSFVYGMQPNSMQASAVRVDRSVQQNKGAEISYLQARHELALSEHRQQTTGASLDVYL